MARRLQLGLALFVLWSGVLAAQEDNPVLVLYPLRWTGMEVASMARQFESGLRVALINDRRATIRDQEQIQNKLSEVGITGPNHYEAAALRDASVGLDADLYLVGDVDRMRDAHVVRMTLFSPLYPDPVLSHEVTFSKDDYRQAIRELASAISDAITMVREIDLNEIEALAQLGVPDKALDTLRVWQIRNEPTIQSKALETSLRRMIARSAYEASVALTETYQYDEALRYMDRALHFEPDSEVYRLALSRLQREQREFEAAQASRIADSVERLIEARALDSATKLLELAIARGLDATTASTLEAQIAAEVRLQDRYQRALQAYWRGDTVTSRALTEELRATDSAREEYVALDAKLLRIEQEQRAARETWGRYRRALDEVNLAIAVGIKRLPMSGFAVGAGVRELSFRDVATLTWETVSLRQGYAQWQGFHLLRDNYGFPFVAAGVRYGASGTVLWGFDEASTYLDTADPSRLTQESAIGFEIAGHIGLEIVVMAFSFDLSPGLATGFYSTTTLTRDLLARTEEKSTRTGPYFHVPLEIGITWRPTTGAAIRYRYRGSTVAVVSQSVLPENERSGFREHAIAIRLGGTRR